MRYALSGFAAAGNREFGACVPSFRIEIYFRNVDAKLVAIS
jgi:hypothetical protein